MEDLSPFLQWSHQRSVCGPSERHRSQRENVAWALLHAFECIVVVREILVAFARFRWTQSSFFWRRRKEETMKSGMIHLNHLHRIDFAAAFSCPLFKWVGCLALAL